MNRLISTSNFSNSFKFCRSTRAASPFSIADPGSRARAHIDEVGRAALLLVLTPIAIARIQWVLNWAFMKGKLNLDQPIIKIAIVEEDIPCAFLALWDYLKTLNHLKSLAGIESSFPKYQ